MIQSILLPLDGSPFGEQALPFALGIARRAGASLRLAHVHLPTMLLAYRHRMTPAHQREIEEGDRDAREREIRYLDSLAEQISGSTDLSVSTAVLERAIGGEGFSASTAVLHGPVVGALLDHAEVVGADLIVITTHGRGGMSRAWLGSVADAMVRRADCPVLLIRPTEEPPPEPGQERLFHHVLIPLDGSELAEGVLGPARALGRLADVRYTLLRVIEPALPFGYAPMQYGDFPVPTEQAEETDAREYLSGIAEAMRDEGFEVSTEVLRQPQPAVSIIAYAERNGVDLIAMATHGHGGVRRLLLGSVTDKVVRGTTGPVLVDRPNDGASRKAQ